MTENEWGQRLSGQPCGCKASRHGSDGCTEPGLLDDEGGEDQCDLCRPFWATNLHADEFVGRHKRSMSAGYTKDEWNELAADRELRNDEFAGWTESELREAFGR